jgi:hypothetical protein
LWQSLLDAWKGTLPVVFPAESPAKCGETLPQRKFVCPAFVVRVAEGNNVNILDKTLTKAKNNLKLKVGLDLFKKSEVICHETTANSHLLSIINCF